MRQAAGCIHHFQSQHVFWVECQDFAIQRFPTSRLILRSNVAADSEVDVGLVYTGTFVPFRGRKDAPDFLHGCIDEAVYELCVGRICTFRERQCRGHEQSTDF